MVKILMIDFGDEDLMSASDSFDQRPCVASLCLEVSRFGDMKFESADSDIQRDFHSQPLFWGALSLKLPLDLDHLVGLDDVAFLDVVVPLEADTALKALPNL